MNAKNIAALLVCAYLSGCGDGSSSPTSKVEYSDKVAVGTIENYTNADWLYQNYFGDYGLSENVKPMFIPALQMLANGFVMQLKTGQDVRSNTEQVHALFLQYSASGQAATFFAQIQNEESISLFNQTKQVEFQSSENFQEPIISEEDRKEIEEAKKRDLDEEKIIKELAEKYQLPYKINDYKEQWFIYSPTMKGGGKGGGYTSGGSAPKSHKNVYGWGWRRGDVVWVNGEGSITGVPGHNAIIWGEGTEVYLNDANTDVGVARKDNVQAWMDKYTEVRALTPRLNWSQNEFNCYYNYGSAYGCTADSWKRMQAWWYTQDKMGYPYNWNFTNPRDTSKFYCSSLIWNAYNSVEYNVIAPWSLGSYGIITPSQLRDSAALITFKVSKL